MTSSATDTFHIHVARMLKLHAETLESRERLQGAGFHVSMADSANRTVGI